MKKEIANALLGGTIGIFACNSIFMYFGWANLEDALNYFWLVGVMVSLIVVRHKFVEQPYWYRYAVALSVVTPFWVIVYLFGTRNSSVESFLILVAMTALFGAMRPWRKTGTG